MHAITFCALIGVNLAFSRDVQYVSLFLIIEPAVTGVVSQPHPINLVLNNSRRGGGN